ncbi:MAG: hypothetical protein OXI19_00870, partial [Gemmatimonadota bacterium]|nr:hypothetical protein [Gemmatimonadota bacterium]
MSAPTPNNIPASEFSLPFTILAIQPDDLSSKQSESYTVVRLRYDEKPEVRTGLDLEAIGGLAVADASGPLLAAYGPEDHLTERLWQIAAGIDAVVLDVRLLARILLPGLRDYERATVERCVEPNTSGTGDALKTAVLCRVLLDLLASQDPDTMETLILLAEGTGTGLERLLARMTTRTAWTARTDRPAKLGGNGSPMDIPSHSGERPPIAHTVLGPPTIGDGSCDTDEADGDLDPMDTEELARMFETGGLFESSMEGYEQRPQQVSMVRSVAGAFNDGEVLLVEAGTGTGKSLSYLTPALIWAVRNDQRVIVSTNTRNLQEQLFYKDLPFLLENLGLPFRATLLKGRSNYLCLDRWRQVTRRPADHLTAEEREAAIPLAV